VSHYVCGEAMKLEQYRTPKGEPTCAENYRAPRSVCRFLYSSHFGQRRYCIYADREIWTRGDLGFSIPAEGCPVWEEAK